MTLIDKDELIGLFGTDTVDLDSIRDRIKSYLIEKNVLTDVNYEGSNISILVDIIAYSVYNVNANTDLQTKEMFIKTASVYANVWNLAVTNFGYIPHTIRASMLPVTITNNSTKEITINRGDLFLGGSIKFTPKNEVTIGAGESSVVTLLEGRYVDKNIDRRSSHSVTDDISEFIIPIHNIDIDTIMVQVTKDGSTPIIYTKVDVFTELDINKYVARYDPTTKYTSIFFSYNSFGKTLVRGDYIETSFIIPTLGSEAYKVTEIKSTNTDISVANLNGVTASKVYDYEDINSIKERAPLFKQSNGTCTIADDYINSMSSLSFVYASNIVDGNNLLMDSASSEQEALTYPPITNPGTIALTAIHDDYTPLTLAERDILIQHISSKKPIGTKLEYFNSDVWNINLKITTDGEVRDFANKKALVEGVFTQYYNDYLSGYEKTHYHSLLSRNINKIFEGDIISLDIVSHYDIHSYGRTPSDKVVVPFVPFKRILKKGVDIIHIPTDISEYQARLNDGWIVLTVPYIDNVKAIDDTNGNVFTPLYVSDNTVPFHMDKNINTRLTGVSIYKRGTIEWL